MDGSNLQLVEAGRIGRVIAVSASQVIVLLEVRSAEAARQSQPLEMGALVKLQTRASTVFGMVNALRVPLPSLSAPDQDLKIVEIELLGEMLRDAGGAFSGFQRGVSVFPSIESPITKPCVASQNDIASRKAFESKVLNCSAQVLPASVVL